MKDKIISFETAKLAKEKGFDIPFIGYSISGHIAPFHSNYVDTYHEVPYYYAPTQSLLQKWLRENYDWNIEIKTPDGKRGVWLYEIHEVFGFGDYSKNSNAYTTYEDALEDGLLEVLKLI